MPSELIAYSVKIAFPGDTTMELNIALEVICDWNAQNALEQKRILLPLYGKAASKKPASDLLVAFSCGMRGLADDQTPRIFEAEIEQQLDAGRPAFIYFSDPRMNFARPDPSRPLAATDLKKRYASQATVDSYGDEKEFRAKFARQLELTIGTHPRFQAPAPAQPAAEAPAPLPPAPPVERDLSTSAVTLLCEACEDFEAYLSRMKIGGSLRIQANGRQLVEPENPEAAARWDSAFQEILLGGYIRAAGGNGQLFQISPKGFDFLKSIGKTPVGYIAEMGGM